MDNGDEARSATELFLNTGDACLTGYIEGAYDVLSVEKQPDGYVIRPVPVAVLKEPVNNVTTLEFRLHEGRKRQIRYMCSAAHLVVVKLKRVAVGGVRLPDDLQPGEWRDLSAEEAARLLTTGQQERTWR